MEDPILAWATTAVTAASCPLMPNYTFILPGPRGSTLGRAPLYWGGGGGGNREAGAGRIIGSQRWQRRELGIVGEFIKE